MRVYLAGPLAQDFKQERQAPRALDALVERRLSAERDDGTGDFHETLKLCDRGQSGSVAYPRDIWHAGTSAAEVLRARWRQVEATAAILGAALGGRISGADIERKLRARGL